MNQWHEIERIFDLVFEAEPETQMRLLDEECAGDQELLDQIRRMLEAADSDSPLDLSLDQQAGKLIAAMNPAEVQRPTTPGEFVGAYCLDRLLGTGGMGAVYLAHRADGQYDQQVALKMLRFAGGGDADRQRLLRERQILADLRHPNIARLLDGGVTDDGTPYLVLEYVDGASITDYCRTHDVGQEGRLRLFLQASEAIHHAHHQGVVHRDLKPSNILVEQGHDGSSTVSVLDFGIASHRQQLEITLTGQVIGTPGYLSPEQARGDRAAVDRRSDVFALGVVLYELLCDHRPFAGDNTGAVLQAVLTGRVIHPRTYCPELPTDLETICLTCLAAEPTARYQSVRALTEDLECYLDGRPISARPLGPVGRLARWARRNPTITAVSAGAMFVVFVAAISLGVGAIKYTRDLERERQNAVVARGDAEELLEFMLQDLHGELQSIGRLDLLEQLAQESLAYYDTRDLDSLHGEPLARRALSFYNVGLVLEAQGNLDAAMLAYSRYRDTVERLVATDPEPRWQMELAWALMAISEVHAARGDLDEALADVARGLEISQGVAEIGPEEIEWQSRHFRLLVSTGWLLREANQLEEAESIIRRALDLVEIQLQTGKNRIDWLHSLSIVHSYLGLVLQQQGRFAEAVDALELASATCRTLTETEPDNIRWREELELVFSRLGQVQLDAGELEAALSSLGRAVDLASQLAELEPDNQRWQRELNVVYATTAWAQRELGQLVAARRSLERALEISTAIALASPTNPSAQNDLAWDLLELGRVERQAGRSQKATAALTRAAEAMATVTTLHPWADYLDTHAQALLELDRLEEARPLVDRLAEQGWLTPELIELCREHGLEYES